MTDDEILTIIQKIEQTTPEVGALAKFKEFGEVALYANRQGYLRIALEMLKCAVPAKQPDSDLHYLFGQESDFSIDYLVTSEEQLSFLSK